MNEYRLSNPRHWVLVLLIAGGLVLAAIGYPLLRGEPTDSAWHAQAIACGPQAGGGGGGGC
jgi:hypothetical protein